MLCRGELWVFALRGRDRHARADPSPHPPLDTDGPTDHRLCPHDCLRAKRCGAITARADASTLNPNDPKPISDWNAIAVSTLLGDTTKSPVETFLYMGFVQAAVYDAVVGIHPRFAPYTFDEKPTRPASAQAAAVAAAHRILETYRPNAKATLDAAMATSLAELRGGKAVENGVAYGHAVADNLIAERANDGRYAPVTFDTPPAPGSGVRPHHSSHPCRCRGWAA